MKPTSKGGTSVPASRLLQNVATAHRIERIVPREHLTIARHFNAGFSCKLRQVPEGQLKFRHRFSRPYGTCPTINLFPALKRRAIFGKSLWDCVLFPVVLILFFAAGATAGTTNALSDAEIQGRQLAQQLCDARPAENMTNTGVLQIRDGNGKHFEFPIKCEVIVTSTNWISFYKTINTNVGTGEILKVTHQESLSNQYATGGGYMSGGLFFPILDHYNVHPENRLMFPFANSDFWLADLGLEFFHWPEQKILKNGTSCAVAAARCWKARIRPSNGYSRVVSWIDKRFARHR